MKLASRGSTGNEGLKRAVGEGIGELLGECGQLEEALAASAASGKKKKKAEEAQFELAFKEYAMMTAVRSTACPDDTAASAVARGLVSADRVAARHAFAWVLALARRAPDRAARMVHMYLPHRVEGGAEANLADTFARVYFCTACAVLGVGTALPEAQRAVFYQGLVQFLVDARDRVAFEAVRGVLSGPWAMLAEATVIPSQGTHRPGALQELITRLGGCLGQSSLPLVHATCKLVVELAEASLRHDEGGAGRAAVVEALAEPVHAQLECPCRYVRVQALRAMVWLTATAEFSMAESGVQAELDDGVLDAKLVAVLLDTLHSRLLVTPGVFPSVLRLLRAWCSRQQSGGGGGAVKGDAPRVVAMLASVMRSGEAARAAVLELVFTVPDPSGTLLFFLGEHGNSLCSEWAPTASSPRPHPAPNKAVRSVLLALERAVTVGTWARRLLGLEALVKIALRASDPVLLRAYEVLCRVSAEPGSCLAGAAEPGLRLIDDLFAARALVLQAASERNRDLAPVLYQAHEALLARIKSICGPETIPREFVVNGFIDVRDLLAGYYREKI